MFQEKGVNTAKVLESLNEILSDDVTYSSGRLFSIMSTTPHPLTKEIIINTIEKNLGRPKEFRGSARIEKEVIKTIGTLLHHTNPYGTTTAGGTESNILAILSFRETAKKEIKNPNIITAETAHPSIHKAAKLLKIRILTTPVDNEFKAIPKIIEKTINKNTIGVTVTAGTTYHGQIDPINQISKIALDNSLPLHVDAAFGGLVIPFLNELGYGNYEFDFKIKGITSISTDPHKMGLAPAPAGILLFKSKKYLDAIKTNIPYLSGDSSTQYTLLGTRPAYSIITFWALLKHLGKEGYRKIIDQCMKNTYYALKKINQTPLLNPILDKPVMNILGVTCKKLPPSEIVAKMQDKNWFVEKSPLPPSIRLIMMPHIHKEIIDDFFKDLINQINTNS
ncbi:MAG: tyrosine decarboxylase MfnA [Candidatus Odinarchaeia archaeon]